MPNYQVESYKDMPAFLHKLPQEFKMLKGLHLLWLGRSFKTERNHLFCGGLVVTLRIHSFAC